MQALTRAATAVSILSCSVFLIPACGGGGTGNTNTELITAEQGGSVTIEGTDFRVDIPANALTEDTEVSLSLASVTDFGTLEGARDESLVLAPDGLALSSPATVTLDPGEPAVTADQVLTIKQFVDGAWITPEVSSAELVSGGLVATSVIRFAPIALMVEDPPQDSGTIAGTVLHLYTEEPLSGITFELMADGAVLDSDVSDASGNFGFANVAVGSYTVHADVSEEENCYNDPVDKDAAVTKDETTDVFFGFVPGPC